MYDKLGLAASNIINEKRRSWLTVIGIFIGIAAVVALVSLGQGMEEAIIGEFEDIGADKVQIISADLTEHDIGVVERADGVEIAGGLYQRSTAVTHRGEPAVVLVVGMPTGAAADIVQDVTSAGMADGRYIRAADRTNIVITRQVAENTFEREIGIRDSIRINDRDFRVVGIVNPSGPQFENVIFMPRDQMWTVFDVEDDLTRIVAQTRPGAEPEQVVDSIEEEMRRDRGQSAGEEDFTVFAMADILDSFRSILGVVQAIVLGIASISLLVGGVGIMNTMFTSVSERTREIGVMKAVGAEDRQILTIFMFESAIIGVIGGSIGVILGAGLSLGAVYVAQQFTAVPVGASITPGLVIGALLFSAVVGMISGVMPARKAALMDPVDALREE